MENTNQLVSGGPTASWYTQRVGMGEGYLWNAIVVSNGRILVRIVRKPYIIVITLELKIYICIWDWAPLTLKSLGPGWFQLPNPLPLRACSRGTWTGCMREWVADCENTRLWVQNSGRNKWTIGARSRVLGWIVIVCHNCIYHSIKLCVARSASPRSRVWTRFEQKVYFYPQKRETDTDGSLSDDIFWGLD